MKVFALTGKTGAGKSTVAQKLREKGCFIIDGDLAARSVTEPEAPALGQLAAEFGKDILNSDGSLNRRLLAERAFVSSESTKKLNAITHPHIKKEFMKKLSEAEKEGFSVAFIDAAAILESDCADLCSKIVVVHAPEEIRLQRILKRDTLTKQEALRRMNAQKEDNYYLSRADYVINNFSPHSIDRELKKLEELFYEE